MINRQGKKSGFTLLELLITFALMALVAAATMPQLGAIANNTMAMSRGQAFYRALITARNEAMLRGVTITVCGSDDLQTCGEDWSFAQLFFVDRQTPSIAAADKWLVMNGSSVKGRLHWRSSLHRNVLAFEMNGTTHAEDGSFWFCANAQAQASWAIIVNQVGRLRYVETAAELQAFRCAS